MAEPKAFRSQSMLPILFAAMLLTIAILVRISAQRKSDSKSRTNVFAIVAGVAGIGLTGLAALDSREKALSTLRYIASACFGILLFNFVSGGVAKMVPDLGWVQTAAQ